MTSKRTSSRDWKLKSADCRYISYRNPSSASYLEFDLTILEMSITSIAKLGPFERLSCLFDRCSQMSCRLEARTGSA